MFLFYTTNSGEIRSPASPNREVQQHPGEAPDRGQVPLHREVTHPGESPNRGEVPLPREVQHVQGDEDMEPVDAEQGIDGVLSESQEEASDHEHDSANETIPDVDDESMDYDGLDLGNEPIPDDDAELMDDAPEDEPPYDEEDFVDDIWNSDVSDDDEPDDYDTILKYLSKQWLEIELHHRVSKTASDAFWSLAKEWFHKLFVAKSAQTITRKTPFFVHIRRRLYKNYVPPVYLNFGFRNKENGDIVTVENALVAPKSGFPSHQFEKLWEIGHVQVLILPLYFTTFSTLLLLTYVFSNGTPKSKEGSFSRNLTP